jgi:acyl dehydratase
MTDATPERSTGKYYEDYEVGRHYRSMGRTITEADLVHFVAVSGLYEEMFQNAVYAKDKSAFEQRVVPGQLVYSFSEGLVVLTGMLHDTGMALLGTRIDIRAPTFVGDTITVDIEVTNKRLTSKPGRGIVTTLNRVVNQRDEVVMEVSPTRMIRCRAE